ncbi:MAG: peptidoglycan DD-metalloendopeptidase family protein [Thermoanaerobaculia bacterium]|nr:peptidoglycan DD-metalloendopeptidase family protein [Thermoanaerobaculia bacterium]
MERKNYTVILVPHARAKFRKLQVSNFQIWGIALAVLLGTVLSGVVGWLYFRSPVDEERLEGLRAENRQLREVNRGFETSVRELQSKLDTYEERTRKLAIVAGLEELDSTTETGIGGPVVLDRRDPESLGLLDAQVDHLSGQLDTIESELDERYRWISSVPSIMPTRGLLTSGFGTRWDPITGKRALHEGLDISARRGRPVVAPADGLVVRAGRIGYLGRAVYLSHGYGLTTRFGHLSEIDVDPGDEVKRGDVIGYVGSTGRSTGSHLHYEVHRDGRPVDPLAYILDRS